MSDLTSFEDFEKRRDQEGRVVILFTSPSWCQPCVRFEPHWYRANRELPDIKFYRVLELADNEWAMVDLGIQSQPTVLVYQDGVLVDTIIGAMNGLPFINRIRG